MSYRKTEKELKLLRKGGKIMGEILDSLSKLIQPGVTAYDLDQKAEELILAAGGIPSFKGYAPRKGDPPFPGTICFCRNDELVHGIPTKDKVVVDGDIVTIDIGMMYPSEGGLYTDTAVTVAVGEISPEIKKLLDVTQESLEVGIAACNVGNTIADIGRAIETFVKTKGGYGIVQSLSGHGVGHAVHEDPWVPNFYVKELEQWRLESGVVIAIEPMLTLGTHEVDTASDQWTIVTHDHSMSAHFEHTVIITEKGPEVVTRRPKEL